LFKEIEGEIDSFMMQWQLYDVTGNVICTGSTAVMREAYKSFPSGHTSCKILLSIPPVLTGLLHM